MSEPTTTFRFNRNYKDLEQVAAYYPAYLTVYERMTEAGAYPYNDNFKGRIPGIEGPDEDTAIYLLQGMRSMRELEAKVDAALADGYEAVDRDTVQGTTKYATIVHYGYYMGGTGWNVWKDARLVRNGSNVVVLPKGKRTNGFLLQAKVMVKR